MTKRDLIRHYASDRAGDARRTSPAARSTCTASRTASTKPGLLAQVGAEARAGVDRRWHNADASPARRRTTSCSTRRRRWPGRRTTAPSSCTRGHRPPTHPHQPTWAMIDIDPGDASTFDDIVVLARLHRTALDHLGVQGDAEGDRPARHADLGSGRRRLHVRRHPRMGREVVADGRRHRAGHGQLGVEGRSSAAGWPGSTSPRTRSTRPSSRRSLRDRRPAHRCRCRSRWDELDDPELRSDRWTIHNIAERLRRDGDPLLPLVGMQQRLPSI